MSTGSVRARFAPSPTGPLHVGSVRTALLNWMFVRGQGGELLLRIDDTDEQRSEARWEAEILDGLRRLGLDWDTGPLRQSERGSLYRDALERLVSDGAVTERDGAYEFAGRVIARADGTALYHLATAVDEIEDSITHVFRGRDHLSNTELQSQIIVALGEQLPQYVHAPLLLGDDGTKLSKRDSVGAEDALHATNVAGLLAAGVLPDAICNALALSLAEFGEPEVMATAELPERFDLDRLHSADSQFDRDRLLWLSGQHIRRLPAADFAAALAPFADPNLPPIAAEAAQTAAPTLAGCATAARELLDPPPPDDEASTLLADPAAADLLRIAAAAIGDDPPAAIEEARECVQRLKHAFKEAELPVGRGLRTLRAALSGRVDGPELAYVLALASSERLRSIT